MSSGTIRKHEILHEHIKKHAPESEILSQIKKGAKPCFQKKDSCFLIILMTYSFQLIKKILNFCNQKSINILKNRDASRMLLSMYIDSPFIINELITVHGVRSYDYPLLLRHYESSLTRENTQRESLLSIFLATMKNICTEYQKFGKNFVEYNRDGCTIICLLFRKEFNYVLLTNENFDFIVSLLDQQDFKNIRYGCRNHEHHVLDYVSKLSLRRQAIILQRLLPEMHNVENFRASCTVDEVFLDLSFNPLTVDLFTAMSKPAINDLCWSDSRTSVVNVMTRVGMLRRYGLQLPEDIGNIFVPFIYELTRRTRSCVDARTNVAKITALEGILGRRWNPGQKLLVHTTVTASDVQHQLIRERFYIPDSIYLTIGQGPSDIETTAFYLHLFSQYMAYPLITVILLDKFTGFQNKLRANNYPFNWLKFLLKYGRVPHGTELFRRVRDAARKVAWWASDMPWIENFIANPQIMVSPPLGGQQYQQTLFDLAHRSPLSLIELAEGKVRESLAAQSVGPTLSLNDLLRPFYPPNMNSLLIPQREALKASWLVEPLWRNIIVEDDMKVFLFEYDLSSSSSSNTST